VSREIPRWVRRFGGKSLMSKEHFLGRILDSKVIAVVRLDSSAQLLKVARAIRAGGIEVVEFTMTTPNALATIEETGRTLGDDVLLGAGTVLDAETARLAILAGARFLVSPTLSRETIETCHRYGAVSIPGALTPTEILTAWEWGADLVKVFPARFGGPQYISDLLAPLPQVRLVPTGGVGPSNAGEFIRAGAKAVAVGGALVSTEIVAKGNFDLLTERARQLVAAVHDA
jgi:2-dehydro-3-deoxyphosphogluconate aldolase/(4S)-4-hydroxy-2-oxoglutarate aldolase